MKLSLLATSAILAIGLTGCWTEDTPTPEETDTVAKAIDGYISGGNVCVDTDGDESTCEYSTTTDSTGTYRIPARYKSGNVIITGGIDLDTNEAFTGLLKTKGTAPVATPLTTLVAYGMTQSEVERIFDLPPGTNLNIDYRSNETFDSLLIKASQQVQAITGPLTRIRPDNLPYATAKIVEALRNSPASGILVVWGIGDISALYKAVRDELLLPIDDSNLDLIAQAVNTTVNTIQNANITAPQHAADLTKTVNTATKNSIADTNLTRSASIEDNSFTVGMSSTSFTQDGNFTAVSASKTFTPLAFTINNNGGELNATAKTMDLAIMIDDKNSPRELKAVLKGVNVTANGNVATITVPANAIMYVEGKDSTGSAVTAVELTNLAQNIFTSQNGVTTVDLTNIMTRIETKASGTAFANITKEGTYDISFYIGGNVTLGYHSGAALKALTAPNLSLSVTTPSGTKTVTGTRFTGTLTVTN